MGKKRGPVNEHERIVAAFARNSLGASGIFHPKKWPNRHEPADILISVRRSLFICNLYSSVRPFDRLYQHNLDQARDRIEEWKSDGHRLKGKNKFRSFDIGWEDIDHIAIVSVVDGPHRACSTHTAEQTGTTEKICTSFTITTEIFKYLSAKGGGPRELLLISNFLYAQGGIVDELDTIRFLEETLTLSNLPYFNFPDIHKEKKYVVGSIPMSTYDASRNILFRMRANEPVVAELFCELDWFDVAFIAGESAVKIEAMSKVCLGLLGMGHQCKLSSTGTLKYAVCISENLRTAQENIAAVIEYKRNNNLSFIHHVFLEFGSFGSFTATDQSYPSPVAEILSALRKLYNQV